MRIKQMLFLAFMSSSITLAANAGSLTIHNKTDHDSTSRINRAACSSTIPGGTTRAHTTNVVQERLIKSLCGTKDCNAEIYMQDSCGGPVIATATFNVNTGLQGISNPIHGFSFQKDGPFEITILGGPEL